MLEDIDIFAITAQLFSIFVTMIVVSAICIVYNVKIRNHSDDEKMSGFLVVMNWIVSSVEDLVVSIMGKRYRKLTPYALYLMFYIFIGAALSMIGLESPATSYTIALSMGFVTFIMIYYFGFKYQRFGYFKRYMNLMELFTQFTPLLSISFRLFGNLLGGGIILGLVYSMFIGFEASWAGNVNYDGVEHWPNYPIWNPNEEYPNAQYEYWWSGLNIFTSLIAPFLHVYFDIFEAGVQSIVFTLLTLSYWAEAMGESELSEEATSTETRRREKTKVIELKRTT